MRELGSYHKLVVRTICKFVSPDIKWYDAHVQGGTNACKVFDDKIQQIQPSGKFKVRVIGFYGVGGIGKTTMCKVLCNALSLEFEDKVCHVEMVLSPSSSQKLMHLREVLKKLTCTSAEVLRGLNEDECKDILCKGVSWKQKTFLALDNVWDDSISLEYVRMFLKEAAFHEGSVVMVTARALRTLGYLGIDKSQCVEVPELSKVDARNLFLFHATDGRQNLTKVDNQIVDECIARCYFRKSEKQGCHYLPLALKVLGMHLGSLGNDPVQWLESLPRVRNFDLHFPEENPVFSVIRLNYDRLCTREQALFMDIAIYHPKCGGGCLFGDEYSLEEWLGLVHRQKWEAIGVQVQGLKEKGLLEDVDFTSGNFSMHDLYREFAEMESQGKLNCEDLKNRRWMYWMTTYPSDLEMTPCGGVWEKLIRLGIEEDWYDKGDGISSLQGVQWKYCSNVVVLKLNGLRCLKGVLNLKGLWCLRSLELYDLAELDGVEGLEDLKSLTYFQWLNFDDPFEGVVKEPHLGQLPASLKVLGVGRVGANVREDVFARCTNLCKLSLDFIRASDGIDFRQCTALQILKLCEMKGLQKLRGLVGSSSLQTLEIAECGDVSDVSELELLVSLRRLVLEYNDVLEKLPHLQKLSNLQHLRIQYCERISEVGGLDSLRQLRELCCAVLENLSGLSNLNGLQHFQHLNLSYCENFKFITYYC